MLSKGNTIGEIADEIGCDPKIVWRTIRHHVFNATAKGLTPNIEPEHWLWQHKGDVRTVKVIRNECVQGAPRIPRKPRPRPDGATAGRNVAEISDPLAKAHEAELEVLFGKKK